MAENIGNLKSKTISSVLWKGFERIFAQLVSAIVTIILARILVPDDYSVVGIVAIFFAFCNIFISGGLNTALIQKKEADILDFSTILMVNLAMAAVLYLAMFFCAPFIANLYDKPILIPIIRVMKPGTKQAVNQLGAVRQIGQSFIPDLPLDTASAELRPDP